MRPTSRHRIFADYFQIFVCDPVFTSSEVALWNEQMGRDRLVALPHTLSFMTGRNMSVPVDFFQHDGEPDLTARIALADHAVIAGLTSETGRIEVSGCTGHDPFDFFVQSGPVGVSFLSFDLASIDDLEGDDRYELHVWPATHVAPPVVLKCAAQR